MSNRAAWLQANYLPQEYSMYVPPVGQLVEIGARGEGIRRFCTGFNFSNLHFITAGHCLSEDNAETCFLNGELNLKRLKISFDYQCQPSDTRIYSMRERFYNIHRVDDLGYCSFNGTERLNYAVFTLEPGVAHYGNLTLSAFAPMVKEEIILVHHPRGEPKQVSYGIVNKYLAEQKCIDHTVYTEGGSSGAPVISLLQKKAIAIHVAETDNQSHHFAVPTKYILETAHVKGSDWIYTTGLVPSPRDSDVIRITSLDYRDERNDQCCTNLCDCQNGICC